MNEALGHVVVKVPDDIFIGGETALKKSLVTELSTAYELGTITNLPGSFLFYGLQVSQYLDYTIEFHADQKLDSLTPQCLSRFRRKIPDDSLNAVEQFQYNSIDGSSGFIGENAFPIVCFVSNYVQQRRNVALVSDISIQASPVRRLRALIS